MGHKHLTKIGVKDLKLSNILDLKLWGVNELGGFEN